MRHLFTQVSLKSSTERFSTTRFLVLVLTFCTGFTGLVYEVTWHRYLSNLLGSQSQAAAMILAVFLGGLCLGYGIFGRFSKGRSPRVLLRMTGWIEIGIGAFAVIFPSFYAVFWNHIGFVDPSGKAYIFVDLLICIALIGAPTILMGGTLPLLTQGLSKDLKDSASFHAAIYAVNTGGAFVGCLVAGFLLIPYLGLPITMIGTSPINLVAGVLLIFLSAGLDNKSAETSKAAPVLDRAVSHIHLSEARGAMVAFLAGFTSLTLQTILVRLVGLTMGSSEYAFSIVVSVFILMIALGARECTSDSGPRIGLWGNQLLIVLGTFIFYLSVTYWPYSGHVVRTLLASESPNFYIFHLLMLLGVGLILYLPVGGMGRTQPLLFSNVKDNFSDLGGCVGRLYGWNTFGCVIGALIGGFFLLFYLNFDQILRLVLLIMILALILLTPWKAPNTKIKKVFFIFVPIILTFSVYRLEDWKKEWLAMGTFRRKKAEAFSYSGAHAFHERFTSNSKLLAYRDDPNTSVAVIEELPPKGVNLASGTPQVRSIWVNGKSDGSTHGSDLRTTRLLAHLPALFSNAKSSNAAVVGYGTGISVGSLTLYPELLEIHALEISPAVREVSELFDYRNYGASHHPKVKWHVSDAYRVLGSSDKSYAVIVSEPSNPWVAGVERLYTDEFYRIAKKKLAPGGVFAQWFHTYSVSFETFRLVVNTFNLTFPGARIFRVGGDVILLGGHQPLGASELELLVKKFERGEINSELKELGITTIEGLLALELPYPQVLAKNAGIHSLDYPKLSFAAGKDFFIGGQLELDSFFSREENQPWEATYVSSMLLASWLKDRSLELSVIENIAKNGCDTNNFKLPPTGTKSRVCNSSLALLAAKRKTKIDSFTLSNEINAFQKLLEAKEQAGTPIIPAQTTQEGFSAISAFKKYTSPVAKIPVTVLKNYIVPCLDSEQAGIECRVKYIEALCALGLVGDASIEFGNLEELLKHRKESRDLTKLKSLIENARSVLEDARGSA